MPSNEVRPSNTPGAETSPSNLTHMRVADIVGDRTEIFALRPNDTIEAAAQKLARWRVRTAAVTDDVGNVAGILGQSDISSRVVAAGLDPKAAVVRDVMTSEPISADVDTDVLTCVRLMRRHGISHIVLTRTNAEGEQYFGMLSANDVLDVVANLSSGSASATWMQELAGGTRQ